MRIRATEDKNKFLQFYDACMSEA